MKKYLPLYLYGSIIILVGLYLLFLGGNDVSTINLIVGLPMTIAAILAFITGYIRRTKQVQFAYHQMHALAMFVYGVSILAFCTTFETFISYTGFLLIFYSLSEIIFCGWLFNLGEKVKYMTLIFRALIGLAIGVGTFVAMNSLTLKVEGFGMLFILVGINILFYVPVMKRNDLSVKKES